MVKMMSDLETEVNQLREYLTDKYRANGGTKDLTHFTLPMITNEIDNQERVNALKKEISGLKNEKPKTSPIQFSQLNAVNQGRENAELARKVALGMKVAANYMIPEWDDREIEDERFKRDNDLNLAAGPGDERSVVILRDKQGRCA